MYDEQLKLRLIELREKKGVSARDMSLSIGQNAGYINAIEAGKALPSMSGFFYICDFFCKFHLKTFLTVRAITPKNSMPL